MNQPPIARHLPAVLTVCNVSMHECPPEVWELTSPPASAGRLSCGWEHHGLKMMQTSSSSCKGVQRTGHRGLAQPATQAAWRRAPGPPILRVHVVRRGCFPMIDDISFWWCCQTALLSPSLLTTLGYLACRVCTSLSTSTAPRVDKKEPLVRCALPRPLDGWSLRALKLSTACRPPQPVVMWARPPRSARSATASCRPTGSGRTGTTVV